MLNSYSISWSFSGHGRRNADHDRSVMMKMIREGKCKCTDRARAGSGDNAMEYSLVFNSLQSFHEFNSRLAEPRDLSHPDHAHMAAEQTRGDEFTSAINILER